VQLHNVIIEYTNGTNEIKAFPSGRLADSYWKYMVTMLQMFPAQIRSIGTDVTTASDVMSYYAALGIDVTTRDVKIV
jgi:hypothetical protein